MEVLQGGWHSCVNGVGGAEVQAAEAREAPRMQQQCLEAYGGSTSHGASSMSRRGGDMHERKVSSSSYRARAEAMLTNVCLYVPGCRGLSRQRTRAQPLQRRRLATRPLLPVLWVGSRPRRPRQPALCPPAEQRPWLSSDPG